jgi:tetratricopeptide (TPR) repeat protein
VRRFRIIVRALAVGCIVLLTAVLVGCRREEPPPTEVPENLMLDEELMREYRQRLEDYRESIDVDFDSADEHLEMARQLEQKWDFYGAALHYRKAAALEPDSAEAYAGLGRTLQRAGDLDGSIAAYQRAIELDPEDTASYIGLGLSRYGNEDLEGALAAYERALEVDAECAEAYRHIAVVHWRKKEYAAAWDAVERCRTLGGTIEPSFLDVLRRDSGRR